ncbi:MAG: tetratricopeptide repeat protein [Muribaculaceae bacterium]
MMNIKRINNIFFLVVALLSVMPALIAGNRKGISDTPVLASSLFDAFGSSQVSDADRRKAEYVYLEAERQRAMDNYPAYFELMRHAHNIDPENTVASYYIGFLMMALESPNGDERQLALKLMHEHYAESPEDYYESFIYGRAAGMFGNVGEALDVWKKMSELYPDKADVQFSLAEAYSANGKFQEALAAYDSLEQAQGKMLTLSTRKINVYMSMHDSIGAINECRSLLASAPKNVQYNLLMSRLFATYSMNDSALAYIDHAQSYDPDNGGIYLARAQFYNSVGDTVNYDKQIYNALINKNLDVESKLGVLYDYSRDLIQNQDSSQRADTLFKVLIEEHPHENKIHELYSQYLWAKKDYKRSGEQLSYALDVDPTSADNWRMLMGCYLMTDNYSEAIKAGENAIKYNPDNVELYKYIAPAYYQLKEYDKSIAVYNKAMELIDSADYESRSELLSGIADVYYMQKDTVKAFATYEQALEANPGNVMAMNNYAYFLSESGGDLDKAEKMSYRTISDSPESSTYLDTYAWILFKKKNYKEALVYIEKAINDPDAAASADVRSHYGDILFMNGEPDAALVQWEEALKLDPENELLKRKVKFKTYFFK